MTLLTALTAAPIVAQGGAPEGGGLPFDPFLIIMLLIFGFLIFSMFRRSKKQQQQQRELHESLAPGVEVMTSMGLFGTIRSIDRDENKAVIEISPGTTATVHLQAIGKAVEPTVAAEPTVPDSPAGLEDDASRRDEDGPDEQRPGTDRA